MYKLTFGTPEKHVPTRYCKGLNYREAPVSFDISKISFHETARGCRIEYPLCDGEQIFGFGLQLKGFNQTGKKKRLCVNADPITNSGDSHAPVPFYVTNKGYGIYVDTARYAEFYCGKKRRSVIPETDNDIAVSTEELYKSRVGGTMDMVIEIPFAKGVDIYIFEGGNITDIVSQYNMFSGGGCTAPRWALGPIYRCYSRYSEKEVLETAEYFIDNDIPCSTIGLEPGWHTKAYSCSYIWNEALYPNYKRTVDTLIKKGFHINLWEHAFVNPLSHMYRDLEKYSGEFDVWNGLVPDFSIDEARRIFAEYHRKYLVDMGIDGFKLDECDSSDHTGGWSFPNCSVFPSGMDGEQYHSLFGTLYMQAILEALGDTPTLSAVRNAGALASSYPFVLYSDLYDHKDFIRGVVNAGFSGLLWTPEVRDAVSREDFIRRLQTNIFSVQCLINAWYSEKAPWLAWDCEDEVRDLLKLRMSLIPMLTEALEKYKTTGRPPVRALVSDYTSDSKTYAIDDEYIFCDLIVAPMVAGEKSRRVYLPEGKWRDFFTKEPCESGFFTVETEGIPVYERIL